MPVALVSEQEEAAIGFLPVPLIVVAAAGAAAASQTDVGSDILAGIPGTSVLAKAMQAVLSSPEMRAFASTPVGKTVLRAVATTAYMSAVPWVGPQLAALTFALPGLARGEEFSKAWVEEFVWRVQKLAEILGVGEAKQLIVDQAKDAVRKLLDEFGGEEAIRQLWEQYGQGRFDRLVTSLAARIELREDAVAMAVSGLLGLEPPPRSEWFDPVSGKLLPAYARVSLRMATSTAIQTTFTRDVLPYAGRMQTVGSSAFLAAGTYRPAAPPPALPPPAPFDRATFAPEPSSARETAGKVALIGSLGAAAAALVWFYVE